MENLILRSAATKIPGWDADSRLGAPHGPNLPRFFAALRMTSVKSIWSPYWPGVEKAMITGNDHSGIVVEDLERALAFCRDVLGLEVLARGERDGGPIAHVVGYEDRHLVIADVSACWS